MPAVFVETTYDIKNAAGLAQGLSALIAQGLNKPERHVTVSIRKSLVMTHGGAPTDFAYVEVRSIGGLNGEVNAALSRQISELFAGYGMDPENIDINFMDILPQNWGKSTGTFGQ